MVHKYCYLTNIFIHLKMTTDIFLYHINGFIWKLAMQSKWDITTRKICTLLLRSTSQEFPWRVTFCTLCYLWAIHKRYLVENICVRKKKSNQLEREKNLCSIACMDESIQQTSIFCLKVSTVLLYSNQTHISMGYNNLLSFACKRNKCLLHKKSFWKKIYIYI
jgi:hypothetical protein